MLNKNQSKINLKKLRTTLELPEKESMNLSLQRIRQALRSIDTPCRNIPAIQVAGTNGKGSIACFIHNALQHSKIKAGLTTSPHLINWNERIKINNSYITQSEFDRRIKKLLPITTAYHLTPFEQIITIALQYFDDNAVELLVLEVGLGGKLDATTAHKLRPIIAMASIGLDHCEYLGESLQEVAMQKAAVITNRSTVISSHQHPIVEETITKTAKEKNATIHWVNPLPPDWILGLQGDIQKQNAAVARGALLALKEIGWEISERNIRKGFASANWPGRLELAKWENMPIMIDGAHNPDAIFQLSRERQKWNRQELGVRWILGIQKQKDAIQMIRSLLKANDLIWIVPIPGYPSWSRSQLLEYLPEIQGKIFESNSIIDVLKMFKSNNEWPVPPPVISGSLYLIGDFLNSKNGLSND